MKYKLLVVTVTFNPQISELYEFIDSFERYNDLGEAAKLVIVDNSPQYAWESEAMLKKYPNIILVSNPDNPGFGASNNLGFATENSDYVLFVNNDVEFIEPVFKELIAEFVKDSNIGCIGIKQDGGSPSFFCKMTAPKGTKLDKFDERYHFISGAFMFFKSSIFCEIGMFDPKMFMYFEEFDVSERLISHGYKTIFVDKLHFLHKVGNRTLMNEFAARKGAETFCYICKKYNIDYKKSNKAWLHRMWKLVVYNILFLKFKEAFKIIRIVNYRKGIIKKIFYGI